MLKLAIAVDTDRDDNPIIETNSGETLVAPKWPQDCESQVVSYRSGSPTCHIVDLETLADDISRALALIDRKKCIAGNKPDWFVRLQELTGT
jgi:hypothetical protein